MGQNNIGVSEKFVEESPFAAKGFHNFDFSATLPRHRWYYFKEGFSAGLVKEAISHITNQQQHGLHILDPFSGSGTTPLASSMLGHHCTGIEVNPFLAFVSKVKTAPRKWRRANFEADLTKIIELSGVERSSHLEGFSTFSEKEGLSKWLFNNSVIKKFASLMFAIEEVDSIYSEAFTLSAIVATVECSNVKRDGKGLRYKSSWKQLEYSDIDVSAKFQAHALMVISDIECSPILERLKPNIINDDSRKAVSELLDDSFDIVITSPPYLNSFDYSDVYRPELFLGNYVRNNKELSAIRLNTIRSHVQVDWPRETTVECDLLTPILTRLKEADNLWNRRIPLMVKAYFDDINQVINGVTQKLKRHGKIWIVVSTSAYGGIQIPVDLIIAQLANESGLALEGIHRLRDLRTSGQQWKQLNTKRPPLRESLIILKKI